MGTLLFISYAILCNLAGLVGAVWLAFSDGMFWIVALVMASIFLPSLFSFVHGCIGAMGLAISRFVSDSVVVQLPIGALIVAAHALVMFLCNSMLVVAIYNYHARQGGSDIPYALMFFSLGTGVWRELASKEDNEYTRFLTVALVFGHMAAFLFALIFGMHRLFQPAIVGIFLVAGWIFCILVAISDAKKYRFMWG